MLVKFPVELALIDGRSLCLPNEVQQAFGEHIRRPKR